MMKCVLKMINFALKMMNYDQGGHARLVAGSLCQGSGLETVCTAPQCVLYCNDDCPIQNDDFVLIQC